MTGQSEEPVNINAVGPQNVAEQVEETRHFDNNADAFDAKQAESLKAQQAPNPTTDEDLAREAYGKDWNERRGEAKRVGESPEGDPILAKGGVLVDKQGHDLGHANGDESEIQRAGELHDDLDAQREDNEKPF